MAIYRYLCRYPVVSARRFYSSMSEAKQGVVLGVYSTEGEDQVKFTSYAKKYNEATAGELLKKINIGGPIKSGDCRLFWGLGSHSAVAVAGLGDASAWSSLEGLDGAKENVRIAAAAGARTLLKQKITEIEVEDFEDSQNAAVGALLGTYKFQMHKNKEKQSPEANLKLARDASGSDNWRRGLIIAESQNFARTLMESPANIMTPTKFATIVSGDLGQYRVKAEAHDKAWAEKMGMGSYLSVSKGSDEPPVFLELTYRGAGDKKAYVCLVGKGITFDSGGISLKPPANMDAMRADMGGAACVAATIRALAILRAPVNVKGLIPLCENMPNGAANKPGDVVTAMNGKTICIDNTDAEGRLILADAISYAQKFDPKYILDIATLTGAIRVALGECVCGAFTNNDDVWKNLELAGSETGDRVWRMPVYKHYKKLITEFDGYDINNIGKSKIGGACTAAAFLHEFVEKGTPWVHLDMASVMEDCSDQSYVGTKGMTGRPTRTLIEFVSRYSGPAK